MRRTGWWRWARLLGGAAILAVLVLGLGTGPFLDALGRINGWSLAAAVGIGIVTTVACAWRWRLVARGLGVDVPLPAAVGACYRSLFLNSTLPGGVLGDVHRGVRHGRDAGDVGRGLRSVVWERTAGQAVQAVLTVAILLVLPSPVRSAMPVVTAVVVGGVVVGLGAVRVAPRREGSRLARARSAVAGDLRAALTARAAWPGVVLASVVVVMGHAATFVVAARTAGTTASTARLLPLAMLVLLAMSVPLNVGGGWGPREGVAAWAFGVAGLGAAQGAGAGVVYGVLALASTLPGAVVLAADALRASRAGLSRPVAAASRIGGTAHG
jgi:uncharacterized membrane protein YbhN (UPF0104 family)